MKRLQKTLEKTEFIYPLNENIQVNVDGLTELFKGQDVPSDAVAETIKNLHFLHSQVLPLRVYIEIQTDFKNRAYKTKELVLFKKFSQCVWSEVRPFTLKTIPEHGPVYLGLLFLFPSFQKSTIVWNGDQIDDSKSQIKYVLCKGAQIFNLLYENILSILKCKAKDPNLPRKKNCKRYSELLLIKDVTIRHLLVPKGTSASDFISATSLVESPWIQLDRSFIQKFIARNPSIREPLLDTKIDVWPLSRISHPITDNIFLNPSPSFSSTSPNDDDADDVSVYYVLTRTPSFLIKEGRFSIEVSRPWWCQSSHKTSQHPETPDESTDDVSETIDTDQSKKSSRKKKSKLAQQKPEIPITQPVQPSDKSKTTRGRRRSKLLEASENIPFHSVESEFSL